MGAHAPRKRTLRVTLSEDLHQVTEQLDRQNASGRTRRRHLQAVRARAHRMAKRSKKAALVQWEVPDHKSLFFLTMVLRCLYTCDSALRHTAFENKMFFIGTRAVTIALAFRQTGRFTAVQFLALAKAISLMHTPSPVKSEDKFQKRLKLVLSKESDASRKVYLVSFFLEFAFLVQFGLSVATLALYANLAPVAFGRVCWGQRIVPVSPRYGQGQGKTWHAQLRDYLIVGDAKAKASFTALITRIHEERVLRLEEARVVHSILRLSPDGRMSRMASFRLVCSSLKGAGLFWRKNMFETLVEQRLWLNPSDDEYSALDDGPGAAEYWEATTISRRSMLEYIINTCNRLGGYTKKIFTIVDKTTKKKQRFSLNDLGLTEDLWTEGAMQAWGCEQGRITDVWRAVYSGVPEPVPPHLQPNSVIVRRLQGF